MNSARHYRHGSIDLSHLTSISTGIPIRRFETTPLTPITCIIGQEKAGEVPLFDPLHLIITWNCRISFLDICNFLF